MERALALPLEPLLPLELLPLELLPLLLERRRLLLPRQRTPEPVSPIAMNHRHLWHWLLVALHQSVC